jgi:hypothetical protein
MSIRQLFKYAVLFLIHFVEMVCSQQVFDISQVENDTTIASPYLEILKDSSNDSSQDISTLDKNFSSKATLFSSDVKDAKYWLRTRIKVNLDHSWFLEILDPHIHEVNLYELKSGKLIPVNVHSGFGKPFRNKEYHYKNFLYELPANKKEITYYINLNTNQVNSFIVKLRPSKKFKIFTYRVLFTRCILWHIITNGYIQLSNLH